MATEQEINLDQNDLDLLEKKAKVRMSIGIILLLLFLIAGSVVFFTMDQLLGMILLIIGGPVFLILFNSSKKIRKEMKSGKKIRISGKIDELTISRPGESISWKMISPDQVQLSIKTPGGSKEVIEPVDLAPGQKDEYFYELLINGRKITLSRKQFFTFDPGKEVNLEILPNNELIRIISH